MSHSEWLAALDENHPAIGLAHSLCLPLGELKQKVKSMVEERFQAHPNLKVEAQNKLHSYLAASALYGVWKWGATIGFRKIRRKSKD
jgi:hypothetical protein